MHIDYCRMCKKKLYSLTFDTMHQRNYIQIEGHGTILYFPICDKCFEQLNKKVKE